MKTIHTPPAEYSLNNRRRRHVARTIAWLAGLAAAIILAAWAAGLAS